MNSNETENEARQPIDLRGVVQPAPVAVAVPGDLDCVLHNLQTGVTYRLNDVGARIWELVETGHTVADIQAQLTNEYHLPDGVSTEQVKRDVATIVTELHTYGLVTVGP